MKMLVTTYDGTVSHSFNGSVVSKFAKICNNVIRVIYFGILN